MAKKLKGITVEIGGDTAPLSKALDGVNKTSRSLQVELRQVERLLKLDPTNTELLAQKQELLGKSINSTEEKLNALKSAQAQVQAQFENGDIGEEQYREFQRELIKTEQELNNIKGAYQVATRNLEEFGDNHGVAKEEAERLSRAVEEQNQALAAERDALKQAEQEQREHAESVKKATEELEKQKEEIKDAAKIIGAGVLAVGTATTAGAAYAVKLSDEFDKAFNTLITRTGASKDEFDSLNTAMENVYKNNFGESIEDVAQSMAIVKTNTNLAGEELQKATEYGLLLRDTFEFEISESTRAVTVMMKEFGLTSEESYNLIAQGAQMGLNKNDDLLDTINEYSVHFNNAGYSAEEMFNALKNGVDAGAFSVDKLGDAVKEFGIRMKDGSATDAIKELGLNVDRVTEEFANGGDVASSAMGEIVDALFTLEDPLKQNELGVALFGTMFEDLGPKAVDALMYIGGEADRTASTLQDINSQKYDDIGSALSGLGRTINTDVVKPLGEELQPLVEEAIDYVKDNAPGIKDVLLEIAEAIGDLVSFIVNNGPKIAGIIAGITTSFLILKGILVADKILKFAKSIKTLEGGFTLANVAAKLFNGTLLANPAVWIGALIAGLVAGLVIFISTNEDLRKKVIKAWNDLKKAAADCWNAVCDFFTKTIPEAWEQVKQLFSDASQWFSDIWNSVKEITLNTWDNIVKFFQELPSNIVNTFNNLKDQAIAKWEEIKTYLSIKVQEIVTNVVTFFQELPYKIGFALGELLANIVNWGVETYNYFMTNVPIWIESISTWFSQLPGKIWTWLSNAIKNIVNWGVQTYNNAKNYASNTINGIINYFSQLPGRIWTWLSNAIQKIAQWGTNTYNTAKNYASNTINGIITYFSQLPGRIWTWLSSAVQKIVQMGSNMLSRGKTAASNTVNSIVNGFTSLPGRLLSIGQSAVKGIWNGITGMGGWLTNKIKGFGNGIVDGFKSALKINSPSKIMRDKIGVGIVEGIDVGIDKEMPTLNRNIGINMESMTSKMKSILGDSINPISILFSNSNINRSTDDSLSKSRERDINITQNIYSPNPMTPSEVARQTKNAQRKLALEL